MLNKLHKASSCMVIIALIIAGCTIDNTTNAGSNPVTEQDLQAASQILGESLSGANSGVVLSISDALSIIAQSNFSQHVAYKANQTSPALQDEKINYAHSYNPDTGIHTVSFMREAKNPFFSKSVTDTLKYIYRDSKSNFIAYPRERSGDIAFIHYSGWRQGKLSTLHKKSAFTRQDTFLVAGFLDNTSELSIEGVHHSTGSITLNQPAKASIQRSYELKITLLNINIEKSILTDNKQVSNEVRGTLSWDITFKNGASQGVQMRGTIELNGDGTALLRFRSSPALYQVNLSNGEIINLDHAFEGRLASVDVTARRFSLVNGLAISFSENSIIVSDPYGSLEAVQEALNGNTRIWAKGEGILQNNQFNSTKVAFKQENDEVNGQKGIAFKEVVTSVNSKARTFTVAGQVSIRITPRTAINQRGDYTSLQQVMEALKAKQVVTAEGSVANQPADSTSTIYALHVLFSKNVN